MHPVQFLALLVFVTAVAWAVHKGHRHRRRVALQRLADEWQMRYAPRDPFKLAARIDSKLPITGISNLRVLDVIYGQQGDHYRYVFTAEYTLGREDSFRRDSRVVTFCDTGARSKENCPSDLVLAPEQLSIVEQYQHLGKMLSGKESR